MAPRWRLSIIKVSYVVDLKVKASTYAFQILQLLRAAEVSLRFAGRSIRIGGGSWVSRRSILRINRGGSITLGRNCEIHPFAMLMTEGGDIRLGDHCSVNPFTIIYGCGGVVIGNGVRIAAHVVIIPESHNASSDALPLHRAGTTRRGIRIEDHVWIGAGAKILDGVTIGRHCVIGANSVVNRSLPPYATAVGTPAKVVRLAANSPDIPGAVRLP
jgi:carbonic anhydrase/acetyltransferase-like protein (isoleucine patch superfamily)